MSKATPLPPQSYKSDTASPQIRILMILEHLIANGPASMSDIVKALETSRSSVFRALKTLEKTGWVTSNHGNTAYFVADEYLSLTRAQTAFPKILPPLYMLMKHLRSEQKIQSDALFITQTGLLQVVESTNRNTPIGQKCRLISGTRAAAAMATLSPADRLASAKMALIDAVNDGTSAPRVEGFSRHLRAIARDGYVWGVERNAIALPMIDQRGHRGAFVLRTTKPTLANRTRLEDAVKHLHEMCMANRYTRLGLFRTFEQDATQHLAAQ